MSKKTKLLYAEIGGLVFGFLLWVDILICMLVIVISYMCSYATLRKGYSVRWYRVLPILVGIIFVLIVVFTYAPPNLPLFLENLY